MRWPFLMISAEDALLRLKEGNARFRAGERQHIEIDAIVRAQMVPEQSPFAIILGCSDSRVPAELVFGQGIGDLFVIRVAGNIVAPSQIGSIEFAAEKFGTRLVVVLGHSKCGAVEATIQELAQATETRSPNLSASVDRIRPGIESLISSKVDSSSEILLENAVRANIQASVDNLKHGSEILESLVANHELIIIGAEYCLEAGIVDFFE
jgi:carbonic anhydrase